MNRFFFITFLFLYFLSGCANSPNKDAGPTVEEMYRSAQAALKARNYELANSRLSSLTSRYPFGPYAQHATLQRLYVQTQISNWESARVIADQFIKENPRHPHVDYVYYIKGLSYYAEAVSPMEGGWLNLDNTPMDQTPSIRAFQAFGKLIQLFPDSEYVADTHQRMQFLRNRIAAHELFVAQFYFDRKAYLAAANRALDILKEFNGSHSTLAALKLLKSSYEKLGMNDLAAETTEIIELNSPS